jgi:hypothetical protein
MALVYADRAREASGPVGSDRGKLHVPAPFHRFHHRDFVGILEIRAYRNAHCDSRDTYAERLDQLREIHRRRLAFRGGIGSDDDFLDRAALKPLDEAPDLQLIGPDALQRRKCATEYVIKSVELPRFLDGLDIRGFFDHADHVLASRGAAAKKAGIAIRDVIADGALADLFPGFADRVGKREGLPLVHSQQVKGEALRCFLPDAGQALQLIN